MMKYMKMYHDWLTVMEPLNDEERGRLITAALIYASTGEVVALTGAERYVFPVIRLQIDRDQSTYGEISEKRAEAGKQGGRPKKQTEPEKANALCEKQTEPNQIKKSQDQDQDQDQDKDKDHDQEVYGEHAPKGAKRSAKRFTPPTVADVDEFCHSEGLRVDAQRFVNHYTANGWMVGRVPMKDWRATVRNWAREDGQHGAQARAAPGQKAHYNPFLEELRQEALP